METVTAVARAMADYLAQAGVPAAVAWPLEEGRAGPAVSVRVKEVAGEPGGFQNYLGEELSPQSRQWREKYGQRVAVTFALGLYSPKWQGAAGCRDLLDQVAGAFLLGRPAGFWVDRWQVGEMRYDREMGMFRGELTAQCRGLLVAQADEGGQVTGFYVKGEVLV